VRKLAALEALSRYGKAQGRMLGSITIAPNQWPTHAVIDWLNILRRVADVPQRDQRMAEAQQVLKSRLSYQGTKLVFSTEQDDYWWWLMQNGDVNTARLLLAVMDDPAWKDDMGRLASGFIGRQQRGAWPPPRPTCGAGWRWKNSRPNSRPRRCPPPVTGSTGASPRWAQPPPRWTGASLATTAMFLPWGSAGKETLNATHQGNGQALAHAAVAGRGGAQGAVQRGLPDQEDHHAGGAGRRQASTAAATCCA
jgi:hypothetical protein